MADLGLKLRREGNGIRRRFLLLACSVTADVPGEEAGILYNPENMVSSLRLPWPSARIAVTPLQMLRGICAIANGGTLLKPYIVKRVIAPDGRCCERASGKWYAR